MYANYQTPLSTLQIVKVMSKSEKYHESHLNSIGETASFTRSTGRAVKRRVSYSAYGGEMLACAKADQRRFYVK